MGSFFLLLSLAVQQGDVPQLNYEKAYLLEQGEVRVVLLDALSGAIQARVAVQSSGSPVHVYVVLEKDHKAAVEDVLKGKKPSGVLASKEKTEDVVLQAAIPAKTGFAVILACAGGKMAKVALKVTAK